MNQRKKLKHAKKELKMLNDQRENSFMGVSYGWYERRAVLHNIIMKKRGYNKHSGDKSILEGKKRTYMALSCGITKLYELKNPNGKPLTKRQMDGFAEKATEALLKHRVVIYNRYKDNEKLVEGFHVMYTVDYSVDSTKHKELVEVMCFYQFKGNGNIYQKKDGKYIELGA